MPPHSKEERTCYSLHTPRAKLTELDFVSKLMVARIRHEFTREQLLTLALINGEDLSRWHSQSIWIAKAEKARRNPGFVLNARQLTIARMVSTARATVAQANGQPVLRIVKVKENRFRNSVEFEAYVSELLEEQEGLCAITGIPLQYDGIANDLELKCSLDRIDSAGHYEPGNLQVVCCFVNRWKNDDTDANFRRLVAVVQEHGAN
jgi:hypothetical protein